MTDAPRPFQTNAEIRKFLEKAKRHARRRGHSRHADDFSQDAWIAVAGGRQATLEQLFIDYLRKEYGRTGVRGGAGGRIKRAERSAKSIDSPISVQDRRPLSDIIDDPRSGPEPIGGNRWDGIELEPIEARIVELLKDGFQQDEIAEIFGVTASRISQRLRSARAELKRFDGVTEALDLYRLDPEASKLVVEWIKF